MSIPPAFRTTSFFGREGERRALDAAFASGSRVVLIVGPPGAGKSRLAYEFATQTFPDRWLWRSLSESASSPAALAAHELAQAAPSLLVIDDVELELEAQLAHALSLVRHAGPQRVILTSRRAMPAPGVAIVRVAPLEEESARRLLASRAALVAPELDSTHMRSEAAGELLSLLGFTPAAIELAAPRLRALSLHELTARLRHADDALWTEALATSARHRSLRALHDSAWAQLDPSLRAAAIAWSACAPSFALETAEALAPNETHAHDALAALIDHSLCERHAGENGTRYTLFSPLVRQIELDPSLRAARHDALSRHAAHFAALAEQAREALYSSSSSQWMQRIDAERPQFTRVIERACADELGEGGLSCAARVATSLLGAFENIGAAATVRAWIDRVRSHPGAEALAPELATELQFARGVCAWLAGDVAESEIALDEAIASAHRLGLVRTEGRARARRLLVLVNTGRVGQVLDESARALEMHRACGDLRYEATTLAVAATFFVSCGAHDDARQRSDAAVSAARRLGDDWTLARALASRAILCLDIGQLEGARDSVDEALTVLDRVHAPRTRTSAMVAAAILAHLDGHAERAELAYQAVASVLERVGDRRLRALCDGFRAIAVAQQGRWTDARRLLGQAIVEIEPFADRWSQALLLSHRAVIEAMSGRTSEAAHSSAEAARVARGVTDLRLERVLAIQRARIEVHAMHTAERHEQPADAASHRRTALDALGSLSGSSVGSPALFGYDVLIAARALLSEDPPVEVRALIESALTMKKVLLVHREGAWFWLSGEGARRDCSDAPVLQRVLAAFAATVAAQPGAVLTRQAFVEAAWPGERILASAAKNRLHVAIAQLRTMGLRAVIRTVTSGYGLDPAVRVLIVDDRPAVTSPSA
ncbi:MAG: AAA family ATPase [Polyangiales bacterium]